MKNIFGQQDFYTPLANLAGWFFTGVVLMLLLELLGGAWWGRQLSYPLMGSYYGLLLALPAGMLLSADEWAPVALTGGLIALALAVRTMFRPKPAATPIGEKPSMTVDRQSARDFFWANSRSFSFASLAFPPRQRRLVGLVYAFCRITDDIVDEGHGDAEEVHRRLQDWLHEARNAYYGHSDASDWLNELMQTSRAHGVPFSIVEELVRGVERDLNPPSFAAVEDLKDYCYGVASTVGLWLCHLNDVRDEWMLDRAAALGRAMQITNIIRDVGEDLGRGRLYLPADVLQRHGLTAESLRVARERGEVPFSYDAVMKEMTQLADREYTLAWEAIPHLPRGFSTPTAVAADIYRGIQTVVARNAYDNLTRRARTSIVKKVALAARGWCRLRWRRLRHRFGAASIVLMVAALVLTVSAVSSDAAAHQADGRTLISLRSLYVEAGDEHDAIVEARALIDGLGEAERAEPVAPGRSVRSDRCWPLPRLF